MDRSGKNKNEKKAPPINQTITQASELSKKIPEASKIESRITNHSPSAINNQF